MNRVSRSVNPTNRVKLGIRQDLFLCGICDTKVYLNISILYTFAQKYIKSTFFADFREVWEVWRDEND